MSIYFFSIDDGGPLVEPVGSELPNTSSARRHAMVLAADLAKSEAARSSDRYAVIVSVHVDGGEQVAKVRLAMQVEP